MKHLFLSVGIVLTAGWSFAQTDAINLQKYWKLRNNFRENFVKIGPLAGESITARALKPLDCVDNYYADGTIENITPYGNPAHGEMHFGDAMIRHGYYLGLLATEYRLLKDAGQDVTGVKNELFYALNAINRLDKRAELEQSEAYGFAQAESLNGFYMREDIPGNFADQHWGSAKLEARCVNSPHFNTNNAAKANLVTTYGTLYAAGNSYQNVPSSDQFSSLMVGFSLVHKLVDNEYVQPPGSEFGFYLIDETKAIVDRMVGYLNEHNWMMINVDGWPVNNGGGDVIWAAYPISMAAKRITGHDYVADWDRTVASFFLNNIQYCITGYGVKDNTEAHQQEACNKVDNQSFWIPVYGSIIANARGELEAGSLPPGPLNNQDVSKYQEWLSQGTLHSGIGYFQDYWTIAIQNTLSDLAGDGKLSSLPSPMNDMVLVDYEQPYDKSLGIIFANYGVASGLWSTQAVAGLTSITGNRQMELINAVLRNETPYNTQISFKGFLDGMEPTGPYCLTGKWGGSQSTKSAANGWASEHRWTWASVASGDPAVLVGMFNGMDYMLFHNLYYLLYKNTLPKYEPSEECFCSEQPVNNGGTYTPDETEAKALVNRKTAFLPYCTENAFASMSNSVNGTLNIEPYFDEYISMSIFPTKFQTENAAIVSGGDVNVRTRFKVCNSKTLTISSGGRMDIEKAVVTVGYNAAIDNKGTIVVKSGTSLVIKGIGKLILRPGSVIQIEDNASLIIDAGAVMEFYGGAIIYTNGPNSKLILRSTVKIMDTGEFKITHLGTSAGKVIIDAPDVGLLTATSNSTARFTFIGKGITDPLIILSPNAKLSVMNDFAESLTIQSCKVELGAGATIQCDQPFYTGSVEFYSTATNGGIKTSETAIINSSKFTDCPVFATMNIENKGLFKAYNSTFTATSATLNPNDQALIYVIGRGYDISTCDFSTKKNYCLKSTNLTLASTIAGGSVQYLGTLPTGHVLTGIYDYSAVEVFVKKVNINKCNTGIEKKSGKLTLRCNTFVNNRDLNVLAGISCLLNMNSALVGGYNTLNKTTNGKNIRISIGTIDIKNGYNFIEYCPNNATITGTINSYCNGNCVPLDYSKNQWNVANTVPTGVGVMSSQAPGSTFPIVVSPVALQQTCPVSDVPTNPDDPNQKSMGEKSTVVSGDMPLIWSIVAGDSIALDELVYLASENMSVNDSSANDLLALSILDELFRADLDRTDSTVNYWISFGFDQMKTALESAFANDALSVANNVSGFDPYVANYAHALTVMTDSVITTENYAQQFRHEINKAHLFRMIGHSNIGLNILQELEACGLDSTEQANLNYWKEEFEADLVIDQIGFAALDTTIIIDTTAYIDPALTVNAFSFGAIITDLNNIAYPNCDFYHRDLMLKEANGLVVFPNPATQEVTIRWNSRFTEGKGSFSVHQPDGRTMLSKSVNTNELMELKIDVSDWQPGVYQVRFQQPGGTVSIAQLIVQ